MPATERILDRANERAGSTIRAVGREIRSARRDRNLSMAAVAAAAGLSSSEVSRIERGVVRGVSIFAASRLAEAVGLEVSVRLYPGSSVVRDGAHVALLARFRHHLHPRLGWAIEVPLPRPGDRRAWDAVVRGPGWRYGVEAETGPRDVQALARRLALKVRDGEVDGVLLVLPRTRRAREFLAAGRAALVGTLSLDGRAALAQLAAGRDPGGSAIVQV